ncbi:MAG: hypothetical protein LBU76_06820 [Azoarcus sp.]|jgi:type IV secretion system protein VirB6/type IV secretion system protein TrbL|nr:hypothetical protein [Azoarcus sp.]
MKHRNLTVHIFLSIIFLCISTDASAQLAPLGLMDTVIQRFKDAASGWFSVFQTAASILFWSLVAISMVWTFGTMALKRADMQEFFAEFLKFIVFVGFFWFLIIKAEIIGGSIFQNLVSRCRRQHLNQKIGKPVLNYA